MAKGTCSCGCSATPERTIFACAGASNVGQVSNAAAVWLVDEGFGRLSCTALFAIGKGAVDRAQSGYVMVIDGCSQACAREVLKARGIEPDDHIMITDMGFIKNHSLGVDESMVDAVSDKAWGALHPEGGA